MNAALAQKGLNYVQVSSVLTKRALDELSVHRAAQTKAAALRPDILKQMLEIGAVGEHQKEAAEAMLASHPETIGLLKLALDKIAKLQATITKHAVDLGEGVDDKEAGSVKTAGDYDSLTDGYVGRKTGRRKASDEAILSVLNAPGG